MIFRRTMLVLLLLTWPALAEDWPASVLGSYQGPVFNGGRIQQLSTSFAIDAQGRLIGHYRVEDTPPFEGDLTDFRPDGPTSGTFAWHDRFGEGTVHIQFDPDRGRFIGAWGDDVPLADHIFDGYRIRAPEVS